MQKIKFFLLSTLFFSCGVFTSCNKTITDIMIVGVNEDGWNEIAVLLDNLDNAHKQTINSVNFYSGKIDEKNVVVAEAPIGSSEAAMVTTIGIEHFSPKYVITEGTSGGHHTELTYNDIILGKDVLNIASYKGDPSNPSSMELQDPTLHSDQFLLDKAEKVENPISDKSVECGTISSSDCWNTSKEYVQALHTKFHEDCEEMESYAVLNVCEFYKTPALAIRIISNNITNYEEYKPELKIAENGQKYTIDLIKAL
ncbi:MAG: 5'-methylthioadenosine/S-adenosylhomocysteine nucleosidase [Bacilli bacterium]|nr:5'-methylthioadenosine/S-adenosylhomocysteine nucleosidase [Bacilli bacterium]